MTKSKRLTTTSRSKRLTTASKGLGLSESVLKLFPKTSRMGKSDPSRWGIADSRKVRVSDRVTVVGGLNDYYSY
jgi:hypothetical protein